MRAAPAPIVTSLAGDILSFDPQKITAYLLDTNHVRGAAKAGFFMQFGFDPTRPDELMDALAVQAWAATDIQASFHLRGYGIAVNAIGPIRAPDGRTPRIRTAWNQPSAQDFTAKFVTAIPS